VRSATFVTLVVGNLALILVNRSWRLPVWRTFRERRNRALKWILAGAGVMLVMLVNVPWLREAFNLGHLGIVDWAVALVAGCIGVAWFELYKLISVRERTRRSQP
jgi:Ca2+-transporting ATPase